MRYQTFSTDRAYSDVGAMINHISMEVKIIRIEVKNRFQGNLSKIINVLSKCLTLQLVLLERTQSPLILYLS